MIVWLLTKDEILIENVLCVFRSDTADVDALQLNNNSGSSSTSTHSLK